MIVQNNQDRALRQTFEDFRDPCPRARTRYEFPFTSHVVPPSSTTVLRTRSGVTEVENLYSLHDFNSLNVSRRWRPDTPFYFLSRVAHCGYRKKSNECNQSLQP